VLWSLKGA
jgi:hypothetical protein